MRSFDLPSRSAVFGRMLDDAALGQIIERICGEGAKCGSYHAHTVPPHSAPDDGGSGAFLGSSDLAQELHIDYPYGKSHAPFLKSSNPPRGAPMTVQVLWMLDSFTVENLAIQVAISGGGVVLVSKLSVEEDLETGRLIAPFDISLATEAYWIVTPERLAERLDYGK